jgi:hypothetical protein
MASDENKSIRDYVEKLADDKLAELMDAPKTTVRTWSEDRRGGRWSNDELEWESYKPVQRKPYVPREDVAQSQREFFGAGEMPSFLDRRGTKRQQYGASAYRPEEWAKVVRPQGGTVVLSDFMVTQITDILMREMCDVLERAQLIFVSEAASQSVRQGFRKIVGEYVQFLNKATGEYSDVEVE